MLHPAQTQFMTLQMRIGDGHAKFFRDLFSSCRVLSPAAAAGLLQLAPRQTSPAAADATRHAATASAAEEEPASAAQPPPDEAPAACTDAAADAAAHTAGAPAAAAAAPATAAESPADGTPAGAGASTAAGQTEQSPAAAAADGAEQLLAVGLSLEGADSDEEADEEWSDAWDSDAEGSAEGSAAPFDGVVDITPEPTTSRNGISGSGSSNGSSTGSSSSSKDSGSPAGRGSITAATLPPGDGCTCSTHYPICTSDCCQCCCEAIELSDCTKHCGRWRLRSLSVDENASPVTRPLRQAPPSEPSAHRSCVHTRSWQRLPLLCLCSASCSSVSRPPKRHAALLTASGSAAADVGVSATLGAWRRLPFVCVPHVRYAADTDAVSFVTADLALEGQQPVRHPKLYA